MAFEQGEGEMATPPPSQEVPVPVEATESKPESDDLPKAFSALSQGKRNFAIKEYTLAISALGEACRIFADKVGPFATESAEAHYYYGKALLENARSELTVLPQEPIAEGNEDESEDEEEEENGENGEEENGEDNADGEAPNGENGAEADGDEEEKDIEVENGDAVEKEEEPSTSAGPSTSNANATSEGAEEEPSSLELGWEAFEIAKVAFQKQLEMLELQLVKPLEKDDKIEEDKIRSQISTTKQRLADTYLLLGDVATESELYTQAVEEYKTALDILKETHREDSREIAQCYFQLGLAYSFDKKFPESIDCFQKAVDLIKDRIKNLHVLIDTNQTAKELGTQSEDSTYSEMFEISELKSLLPEMEEKVTDTIDAQKESLKTKQEEQVEQEIILRNSPVKNPPAAKDISHLVKKKKKLELDETESEESNKLQPAPKRLCLVETGVVVSVESSIVATPELAEGVSSVNGNKPNEP